MTTSEANEIPEVAATRGALTDVLSDVVSHWQQAQVVYESVSWRGEPMAVAAVEQLVAEPQRFESAVASLLQHPNPLVVAYALRTLHLMHSSLLVILPGSVLRRCDPLTVQIGSFRNVTDLGRYANHQRRLARERLRQPWGAGF